MRRIVTHREQQQMRRPWLTAEVDDTVDFTCDPNDPTCRTDSQTKTPTNPNVGPAASPAGTNYSVSESAPSSPGASSPSSGGSGARSSPSRGGGGAPVGGPASQSLTEALQRAGIDPSMYPLISGFSAAEGNNPSGAPTLGFTDSQAGTTLDQHAQALAQQFQDRESVSGPFPHAGSPAEQASWMATTVGQNGSSSDWQGNAQPARSDYVDRIVRSMPGPAAPALQQQQAPTQPAVPPR